MSAEAGTLDEAWAAAEAALPEGWTLDALRRGGDGVWRAYADSNQRTGSRAKGWPFRDESGPSPAAALQALAAALRAVPA